MKHLVMMMAVAMATFGCACEPRGGQTAGAGGAGGPAASGATDDSATPAAAAPTQGAQQAPAAAPPPAPPAEIDWSTVAPAPERDARNALFGIVRQLDLKRAEDTGSDVLSYAPEVGPEDTVGYTYALVTVFGDTFEVTPSHWLGLFDVVEQWQATRDEPYMVRPMPDARYGDGETSERGGLLFAFVVEDRQAKTLKVVWDRQ